MKQRCMLVDDEQTARDILVKYIQETPTLELVQICKNALEALAFVQNNTVDLIFLDIEMPKLSGINFAKIVGPNSKIIFTTAHRDFAVEGFELNAVDYLLKPFSFDRFLQAVQKTSPSASTKNKIPQQPDHIFVKANRQMVKINFTDLLYVEGLSNYVKFYTAEETFIVYEKLNRLTKNLPASSFMRIHKSYIINTKKIARYTREYVEIHGRQIPVSASYRQALLSFLK